MQGKPKCSNAAGHGDFLFTEPDVTGVHCVNATHLDHFLFTGLERQLSLQPQNRSKVAVQSAA